MRLCRYKKDGKTHWGCLKDSEIVDLMELAPTLSAGLNMDAEMIRNYADTATHAVALSDIDRLLPPISAENRIFCIGINYHKHVLEAGRELPKHPSVFMRSTSSFVGSEVPVEKPNASDKFDYEAELGVVIGKTGREITERDAMGYVAGYTCVAENSVRDFQKHSTQVTAGKNFDYSGAMGPWVTLVDEIPSPKDLTVIGRLNDEIVQKGEISDLIFSIPELISYVSTFTCLQPGDVIATGTPDGVGFKRTPPRFLKPGDIFQVEIDGIGTLANIVTTQMEQSA